MKEILLGTLWFEPEFTKGSEQEGFRYLPALSLFSEDEREATYKVPHYAPAASGRCFGPLALDQVLQFCYGLNELLTDNGAKVVLYTGVAKEQDYNNALVLIGAFLLWTRNWTPKQLTDVLGAKAGLRGFVCSFASAARPEPPRVLRVKDCWEGLSLARDMGWFDTEVLYQRHLVEAAVERHRRFADIYDAAWLIPGRLMVSGEPVTTAMDPNPATVKHVFPPEGVTRKGSHQSSSDARSVTNTTVSAPRSPSSRAGCGEDSDGDGSQVSSWVDTTSNSDAAAVHEVFQPTSVSPRVKPVPSPWGGEMKDVLKKTSSTNFVDFLLDNGVGNILRTNALQERGMITPSYDRMQFINDFGIQHFDIPFEDGAVPSKDDVREALTSLQGVLDGKGNNTGLLVHCKGGFGRSVMMACCLMIDQFDISGLQLLAWVRIARPGAVNTPRQERFLQSLTGRADLHRYMKGAEAQCGLACSVQ
mmetsp:Transcript_30616/g.88749  ORF Transcript_30616/g.88749 Transcript_30616/m.88749 type:complete len:475 (+) Transcript_30616:94-1518(+)